MSEQNKTHEPSGTPSDRPVSKKSARREEKQAAKAAVRRQAEQRGKEKQPARSFKLPPVRTLLNWCALIFILCVGVYGAFQLNALEPTFNGKVDVATLYEDPTAYDLSQADGAAYVIVSENLAKTNAQNVCFSVVFNFRGYDTMGESFILISALSGSLCVLRNAKRGREKLKKKEEAAHGAE